MLAFPLAFLSGRSYKVCNEYRVKGLRRAGRVSDTLLLLHDKDLPQCLIRQMNSHHIFDSIEFMCKHSALNKPRQPLLNSFLLDCLYI